MGRFPSFFICKFFQAKNIAGIILFSIVLSQTSFIPFVVLKRAEAAVVTIDATTSANANEFIKSGSQTVFTSDQTGYKFYVDLAGTCVYSKTTNGGTSWGAAVTVDAQTDCEGIAVWYDRWTPGDYGNYIHITTMESASVVDGLFYNRLDTTNDGLWLASSTINISASSSQTGSLISGTNSHAMTKSTSGEIFVTTSDADDSYIVRCSSNCNLGANWTEAVMSPVLTQANNWSLLMPLSTGGVMIINRNIVADDIRSSTWNGTSWTSWNAIDSNAVESGTYDVGMSATVDTSDGNIYLAYGADHDNYTTLDHDVRTAKYSGGSWSLTTALFTNTTRGLHDVAIAIDSNKSEVYVAYTLRTTPAITTTANVYYASSTNAMSSWSAERGPVNSVAQNLFGLDLNIMSDERIYATWHDPNLDDVLGETIADIAPATKVTSRGTTTTSVNASTTNQYLGGMFVIKENQASRSVTDIVVTEAGTIDASTAVTNIKLRYDFDTSAPYDCVSESYSGGETQFGSTDVNGFSAANGSASFSDSQTISLTQSMCVYVVLDVLDSALDGDTIAVSVNAPNSDVIVSGGVLVSPITAVSFASTTLVINDKLTQTHYHWRNDNGNETAATSATGGTQDTVLAAVQQNSPRRLRLGVSNEGSISAPASSFRLEYGTIVSTCAAITSWTDVGATDDAWNMFDSSFFTNGTNTTNISTAIGGVTDENTTFLTPNGGLRDTSSQTGSLTLSSTNFTELEFSVVASTSATEGQTYCFRITNAGTPLSVYSLYPSATVSADVTVSATGTQTATLTIPNTNLYVGAAFVVRENVSSRTLSDITITETGTVDALVDLDNIKLRYDLDTTLPYDCASESYGGGETQFGSTDTDGFSSANGSSTFSGAVTITTTQSACLYVVLDLGLTAQNGETIQIELTGGGGDVVVSGGGTVAPLTPISLSGTTTLAGAVITQNHYHWRNDNGSEASATSLSGGSEDSVVTDHQQLTPVRLRLGIENTGAATSSAQQFVLEFGPKITTCSDVGVWTNVGAASDGWNVYDSSNLVHGSSTTNIATGVGGVTDPGGKTFLSSNGAVSDTSATSSSITLGTTQFVELEYSITSTAITAFDTTYCFRVTNAGDPIGTYTRYAEITTAPKRDFKVQRGESNVSGTGLTLTAGVNYVAPSSTSSAFVRITNTHHTGAGKTAAGGGSLNADDTTAYITAATNLGTSFTISRPSTATSDTRVAWEIVEFIGQAATDNEMIVRRVGTVSLASASTTASGTVTAVGTSSRVVVYITGIANRDIARNFFYAGQVTSDWNATSSLPTFLRGSTGAAVDVSYAVVEYTGVNWNVQRVQHTYVSATSTETESITPVNNLSRTFIHAQKRMSALANVDNFGHEVWLSSIGAVSFRLEPAATTPSGHTSVVWVIENMQTSNGRMKVQRSNGTSIGGTEPVTIPISIFTPVNGVNNTSIFANTRVIGANTTFPNVFAAASITSTTTYQLWRSEASNEITYRTEIVEWPVTGLAVRQNYYRFYVDNGALKPTDIWPYGGTPLGENTSITAVNEPPGDGERLRMRMTLKVSNANLPAGLYDFKLQYALRVSTCSAIATWSDVGNAGSGVIWRLFDSPTVVDGTSLSTNPATGGDLLISASDIAGSYIESSPSPTNPYPASPGEDIEYDWHVEHNGALQKSTYCFRMIRSDDEPLDGYLNYPQVRTAGYTPAVKNWRWYDDVQNETPSVPLAGEEVAPIEVVNQNQIALRVTLAETKNVIGPNIKFKVQFDETPLFTNPRDVVATSTCTASSTWCYSTSTASDNQLITTGVLSSSDSCVASVGNGCGVHNTSGSYITGDTHAQGADREYAFYLKPAAPRVGAVYYFRLFEMSDSVPVLLTASSSYPSLVAESATLSFTVTGLPIGTTTAGVVLDASSSPSAISFGSIPLNTNYNAAHRISLTTNATEGYRVLMFARQQLLNTYGTAIPPVTGSNASPLGWLSGCSGAATGCVGYHTTDATLYGSSDRFSPLDSFAGLSTAAEEVMYNSLPSVDIHDILYRIRVNQLQPAGNYETEIVYIAVPTY